MLCKIRLDMFKAEEEKMKYLSLLLISSIILLTACKQPTAKENPYYLEGWNLVWQDEFSGVHLDGSKWNYEIGGAGWGNNELEYYTDRSENVYVQDGHLTIEARAEHYENREYTSARITTKNKGDWLYGRFEIRAKLPKGQGLWPAIWMLPTDWKYGGWAASGELDIMELLGNNPRQVFGTLHFGGVPPANTHMGGYYKLVSAAPDFSEQYHLFVVEWDSTQIRWYVDDSLYISQSAWYSTSASFPAPFDKRFHLLLNVAVGGNWPGSPDATTRFPQRMDVDYVRVYQKQ